MSRKLKMILIVLLGVLAAGCSTGVPSAMRAMMMDAEDIPQEWVIFKESKAEDWGGELFNVAFAYGNEPTDPGLEHQLIVYTDEAVAVQGFEEYNAYIFVEEWQTPAETTFAPSSDTDRFEYKCVTREVKYVMVTNCFALQQHGIYVSALGVQLGGPLTLDVVDQVLTAIDGKLASGK